VQRLLDDLDDAGFLAGLAQAVGQGAEHRFHRRPRVVKLRYGSPFDILFDIGGPAAVVAGVGTGVLVVNHVVKKVAETVKTFAEAKKANAEAKKADAERRSIEARDVTPEVVAEAFDAALATLDADKRARFEKALDLSEGETLSSAIEGRERGRQPRKIVRRLTRIVHHDFEMELVDETIEDYD